MKTKTLKTFLILCAGIFIVSCGSTQQQAMLNTIGSPQGRPATFEALGQDFEIAERDQVNLISPAKYLEARKLFREAEALKAKGHAEGEWSGKLNEARNELDSAVAFSRQNKARLSPLIEARQNALSSGAAETANRDLKALEEKYLGLVLDLDRRNVRSAAVDRIPVLTQDYKDLTIKTLQAAYLGEANTNVGIAKAEGAEKLVPKTLKETEEAIKKARDYISQNQSPASVHAMGLLGDEATAASHRLLALTRETKAAKDLSLEDRSLQTEALSKAAIEEATRLRNSIAATEEKISELESKTKNYAKLEQKYEKNKKFESVRELFNDDEAKVSRQGNSLIISLKKINFAVNGSEIPSPSFVLLKKVQTAIHSFKDANIVVEGHTDSTGDAAMNKALSEQRAEAVKEYLLSNSVVPPDRLVALGFGSEKPLASNKSSAGRAINRRIDIVIKD